MLRFICIMFSIMLLSCSKDKDSDPQVEMVAVTYEVQSSGGILDVKYGEYYKTSTTEGIKMIEWPITTAGTFTKVLQLKKGFGAEISGRHASSDQWQLKIKSNSGSVLKQTTEIKYFAGPPGYYHASIQANP